MKKLTLHLLIHKHDIDVYIYEYIYLHLFRFSLNSLNNVWVVFSVLASCIFCKFYLYVLYISDAIVNNNIILIYDYLLSRRTFNFCIIYPETLYPVNLLYFLINYSIFCRFYQLSAQMIMLSENKDNFSATFPN